MAEYKLLKEAFHLKQFRKQGHHLVDLLADYLELIQSGEGKVTDAHPPDDLYQYWKDFSADDPTDFFQKLIDHSIKIHHPRYIGHQVSAPAPLAALSNLATGLLNNGMGIYEMGEGATAIEKAVVNIFCKQIGYKVGDGVLTSGGTLANLTALLAARAGRTEDKVWTEGTHENYCIMVSELAHYCIDRAVRIMGWGDNGIIKVPVNAEYSMDVSLLEPLLSKAKKEDRKVIGVVGSASCTATGSYDDLSTIGAFCKANSLWFHIDGAHGGPAIFSSKYEHLMNGAANADSIAIDAHKMMLTPALTTALLFKDQSTSYQTFSQDAYYLWEGQEDREWFNIAKRSFECTKVMMAVRVMALVQAYGLELFDEFVTRQYDLAREFASVIDDSKDFELATEPHSNIVCFRYVSEDSVENTKMISELNRSIRKAIYKDGKFYLVQTQLNKGLFLRVCLMNPLTTMDVLNDALEEIRKVAHDISDA